MAVETTGSQRVTAAKTSEAVDGGWAWTGRLAAVSAADVDTAVYLDRMDRIRAAMVDQGIDTLLLSVGHDLPYLTGYTAMPLERLTMLVVPRDGDATMIIPRLEAPRVVERPGLFTLAAVGRDRGSDGDRRKAGGRFATDRGRRPDVGAVPRRVAPARARGVVRPRASTWSGSSG